MESECNGEGKGKSLNGSQFERTKAKGSQRSWVELLELETLLSWSLTGTIDMFAELVKMEMRIEEGKANMSRSGTLQKRRITSIMEQLSRRNSLSSF